jgi:hypothetical protein
MTPWFGSFRREPSPPPLEEDEDPEEGRLISGMAHDESPIGTNNNGDHHSGTTAAATIMAQEQHERRRRAGAGATFSSTKCPPQAGRSQACEIPFGLVWSPMMSPPAAVPSTLSPVSDATTTTTTTSSH